MPTARKQRLPCERCLPRSESLPGTVNVFDWRSERRVEAQPPGEGLAPGEHEDRVVAAVGDHRDDRHPVAEGELHEAGAAGRLRMGRARR